MSASLLPKHRGLNKLHAQTTIILDNYSCLCHAGESEKIGGAGDADYSGATTGEMLQQSGQVRFVSHDAVYTAPPEAPPTQPRVVHAPRVVREVRTCTC